MRIYCDKNPRGVAYLVKKEDDLKHYEIRNREGNVVAYEAHGKGSKPALCLIDATKPE